VRRDRGERRLRRAFAGLAFTAVIAAGGSGAALAETVGSTQALSVALPRVGGTPTIPVISPAPPGVTTGPVPQVPVTTVQSLADKVIHLPAATACVTSLRVALVRPAGVHLRTLGVHVGRRHVVRHHVPKAITFHLLPKGLFTVKVSVTTTTSTRLTRSRRYDRCG
jgi:hypothetical protein